MADSKSGYAGKVQHAGAQKVNAPYSSGGKKGQSTVKPGGALGPGRGGRSRDRGMVSGGPTGPPAPHVPHLAGRVVPFGGPGRPALLRSVTTRSAEPL